MAAPVVQAQFDALDEIAARFGRSAESTARLREQLDNAAQPLEQGGWRGDAASAFFNEMRSRMVPTVQRLIEAFEASQLATTQISQIIRAAEEEAAAIFRDWGIDGLQAGGGLMAGGDGGGGSVGAGPDPSVKPIRDTSRDYTFTLFGQSITIPFFYPPAYVDFAGSISPDGVSPGDIRQGALGDCYFLAALASIALQNPEAITNSIRDNGDGTYTVTFYDGGNPVEITVDNDFPVYQNPDGTNSANPVYANTGSTVDELWPMIMEKAYATYVENSYPEIEGGWPEQSVSLLTDTASERLDLSGDTPEAQAEVLQDISDRLDSGDYVTAGTRPLNDGEDGSTWPEWVVAGHAYSVERVDPATGLIYLRNPWGDAYTPDGLTLDEFNTYFAYMASNEAGATADAAAGEATP